MTCAYCGIAFAPKHPRARFCRTRCRVAAWQGHRRTNLEELEALLTRALEQVRALRQGKQAPP